MQPNIQTVIPQIAKESVEETFSRHLTSSAQHTPGNSLNVSYGVLNTDVISANLQSFWNVYSKSSQQCEHW
jgi:hypothetical protein